MSDIRSNCGCLTFWAVTALRWYNFLVSENQKITIFTDGASRGNPGPGGYAAIIIFPESNDNRGEFQVSSFKLKVQELGGREKHTTNNRMELRAAIEALSFLKNLQLTTANLQLFSDSRYVINGITKWIYGWQKNGWQTTNKKEVENRDLWEHLLCNSTIYRTIKWKYVGGHVGVQGNDRCDEIATAFADNKKVPLYKGTFENYPIKNILNISFDKLKEKQKSDSKSRSRASAFSYVSMLGSVIQTHKTWSECEKRVKGKSGAKFKKALTAEEKKDIIEKWQSLRG